MEFAPYAPWLLLFVAVALALLAYRVVRARARRRARRNEVEIMNEDEALLDSSHISGPIPGVREFGGDAAARAAAAMRAGDPPLT
jgi:peptidoglycan/LPS O-acetylase OafA/YrhL